MPTKLKHYNKMPVGQRIVDIARVLGVSRQRAWQIVKQFEGKCVLCSKPLESFCIYCDEHREAKNERQVKSRAYLAARKKPLTPRADAK